jgi:nucleotide-binding universal stress UspA family protein/hemerythrin-like domain-containing protein
MYKHLLVPLDDTAASSDNIRISIDLARRLDARITFFHATPDWGSTEDAALARVIDPAVFAAGVIGETNALLSKAAASARSAGVDCSSVARTSDRPAEAIVEVAVEQGCDLIVMASHGVRRGLGWLASSRTERVLRRAPVALLVSRVETSQPLRAQDRAVGIILDEHRSIAVVVQGMRELARDAASEPGFRVILESMAGYLHEFPERVHHPKEERHLHRLLRERLPALGPVLAQIEEQHVIEREYLDEVSRCLDRLGEDASGVAELVDAIERMADFQLRHIGYEERVLLPLARSHLLEHDWIEIANAFAANDDPGYGDLSASEFRRLFTRIANSVASSRLARAPGARKVPAV